MAFRTLEITKSSEIHIKDSQLMITQEDKTLFIPIEDLHHIICHGPDIRLSTMALSRLAMNKVVLTTLDEKYLPTAIVFPYGGSARHSLVLNQQIIYSKERYQNIWFQIIKSKISNQQRVLAILNRNGFDEIEKYANNLNLANIDNTEALVANVYFHNYFIGLNRRENHPINSRLNYGYSILRSAIAKSVFIAGFYPALGIHHNNQYNAFNLIDDLIEPFRPIVDLIALEIPGENIKLDKQQRTDLSKVLFSKCIVNKNKSSVLNAIELMVESYKRIIVEASNEEITLPAVLPAEFVGGITE